MAYEYRVRWRREDDELGPPRQPRHKIYQKRRDAERWIAILEGRVLEFDGIDPDDYACCSGSGYGGDYCDCGGITQRERIEQRMADVPPLVEGPILQAREVGEWAGVEPPLSEASPEPSETSPRGRIDG